MTIKNCQSDDEGKYYVKVSNGTVKSYIVYSATLTITNQRCAKSILKVTFDLANKFKYRYYLETVLSDRIWIFANGKSGNCWIQRRCNIFVRS